MNNISNVHDLNDIVTSICSRVEKLERETSSGTRFLGSSITNDHGVEVTEGAEMGLVVRIDRVGVDRDGTYALITMGKRQNRYSLNQIAEIKRTPIPF
jgi:hypothetical protein